MIQANSNFWDVIVIGAGPAGSSAAYDLASEGLHVLLLEKYEMPRDKLCGGALSELSSSYLRFSIPKEYENCECYGARINYNNWSTTATLNQRVAILVTRRNFDYYLVQQAKSKGAVLRYEQAVSLNVNTNYVSVKTEQDIYCGKLSIIATGATSKLTTYVRQQDRKNEKGFCLAQDYPTMEQDPFSSIEGLTDIYFNIGEFGYGWVFHHRHYYSIGIGALLSNIKNPKKLMRQFWNERGFPMEDYNPKGHMIPCGGINRTLTAKRLLLAGDTAGFVDPFSGEGIAYAIRSGQLAAFVAIDSVKNNDFSHNKLYKYEELCRKEIHVNLWYSLQLTRLMHWKPNIFLRLMSSESQILKKYLYIPKGELSYFRYITWLLPRIPMFLSKILFNTKNEKA